MIKLIVTDLDGTLLNDEKQIPADFAKLEQKFREEGVSWVLASGRQYFTIVEQFSDILDDVYIIAENGAIAMKGSQLIHLNPFDKDLTHELIVRGRNIKNAWPILCGRKSAWVENDYQPLLDEAQKYYKELQIVDDLTLVDDVALKFTMCDFTGSEINSFPHFEDMQKRCRVAVAGEIWLDMTNLTATKGTALLEIMKHSNASDDEVMAFGDYMNDREMLEVAGVSYAMKNSHPDLFKSARFITLHDNNNNGVIREIKEYFKLA